MVARAEELELVCSLLKENSTIGDVSAYLKRRGVTHSAGSWEQLIEDRLKPSLGSNALSREDLVALLRMSEEHGRQHVFLYRCPPARASELVGATRVREILVQRGLDAVLERPRILDQPRLPTITDVRFDSVSLIMKVVKQRKRFVLAGESEQDGYVVRKYKELRERAVNLFRLASDGILELRVFSHRNSSDYAPDVSEMWTLAGDLLPRVEFEELSLSNAKENLWQNRAELENKIRYSDSQLRNSHGFILSVASGNEDTNIAEDEGTTQSVEVFREHDAYCDRHDLWMLAPRTQNGRPNGVPSKDIHFIVTRAANEFVLTSKCSKEDYDHVFDQLKGLNGTVSGSA